MKEHRNDVEFDVLVAGVGLAGYTAALALANSGLCVALVGPPPPGRDPRTTAILQDSVKYLEQIGVWEAVRENAFPLKVMRLADASSRLFRFPQTDFISSELELEAFGYNVRNQEFLDALSARITEFGEKVVRFQGTLDLIEGSPQTGFSAEISSVDGVKTTLNPGFIVGADGRNSLVRKHFGGGERQWSYPQTAIVLDFEHEFSSACTSTEFHTETGPFTIVPQANHTAGLVWLADPQEAAEIADMDFLKLGRMLEERMSSWLGKVTVLDRPKTFPMSGLTAKRFGGDGHALIGEAAHVFPPIGAQGFNLGIRDIRDLCQCLTRFTVQENPGENYHRMRSSDILSRTYGVDLLNRSLLSGFLPVQLLKSVGMLALGRIAPLRRQAMKSGISPLSRIIA